MIETVSKERQLLKKLIKVADNYPDGKIPFDNPLIDKKNYYFQQLRKKKFIEVSGLTTINGLGYRETSYALTDKGKHFFEKRREALRKQLITSIYLPILVAFITTCITLVLKHLLSALLGWK